MADYKILRNELVQFIKRKFVSRNNISFLADDIVNQGFVDILAMNDVEKMNFRYMSVVCTRIAYKILKKDGQNFSLDQMDTLVSDDDVVREIMEKDDVEAVLNSLAVLKEIEKIIIRERYYADFTFQKISDEHGIKLNTVLSHHRRALEKLRPEIAKFINYTERTSYHELFEKQEVLQ